MFARLNFPLSMQKDSSKRNYSKKGNELFTEDGIKIYKIYIPHVGRITSKGLENYFRSYGEIEKVEIISPQKSESGFRFCFIEYKKAEDATKALAKRNHIINGKKYVISAANSWHQPNKEAVSTNAMDDDSEACGDLSVFTLNDDCLLKVFSYLPMREQLMLAKISPRFQEILELHFKTNHRNLNIHEFDKLTLWNWRELMQTCGQYIKSVVYCYDLSTDKVFDLIISFSPNLESLSLSCITKFMNGTFHKMNKRTPKLKKIELADCKLTDKLINEMTRLKELTELSIRESFHITGMYFKKFSHLKHLDLNQCSNIQSKYFLEFLKVAGDLESLNILRCSRFNNDVFNQIPVSCKSLKKLVIGTTYSGWNLQKVAEIENLESLTIHHTDLYLKEEILKDLSSKRADQMKEFQLILSKFQKTNFTDLNNVLKFKNLEKLTLQGFKDMKNDYLILLAKEMKNLRRVSLAYNEELTQSGILKFIESCPLLTGIDLTHCVLGTDFSDQLMKLLENRRSKQNYEEQQKPFLLELSMDQYRQSQVPTVDKSILLISYNYHLSPMEMLEGTDDEDDDFDDDDEDSFHGWMESDDENDLFNLMINAMFDSDDDFYMHHAYGYGDYDDFSDEDLGFM